MRSRSRGWRRSWARSNEARTSRDFFMFRRKIEVDPELVRELSRLLEENKLTEIEVQKGDQRVRVSRGGGGTLHHVAAAPPPGVGMAQAADAAKHPGTVPSPMVG